MHGRSGTLSADAMIAATAHVLGLIVTTKNGKDFGPFRVQVFNPFEFNRQETKRTHPSVHSSQPMNWTGDHESNPSLSSILPKSPAKTP
jgi:hypothetical protein